MIIAKSDRLRDVGEYYFSRKLEQVRQMRLAGHDVVNLGIGSPDQMPPSVAIEAASASLHSRASHGYASYRSSPELRKAIADWYLKTYGLKADPDSQVLPLLGSKEGIFYVSMAFLDPGDQVLVPNPGYPAYTSASKLVGAQVIPYELSEANGGLPNLVTLEALDLSRCKLMWVNYPHMPTGRSANQAQFEELLGFARQKGILVCNDNPYGLVLNPGKPVSILSADPAMQASLELNSLSKSFSMAGWRVGMLIGSAEVVDAVVQVKSNVDSGMFLPLQAAAIAALGVDDEWHAERNDIYRERREVVWKIFDQLGFTYERDQVGLFVWAKAPDSVPDVERLLDDLLEQKKVFITPGFIFGSAGRGFARASLCAPVERLNEALARIGGSP